MPPEHPTQGIFHYDGWHFPGQVVAVLYAELGSPEFPVFHQVLKELAITGKVDYVLRHRVKVGMCVCIKSVI